MDLPSNFAALDAAIIVLYLGATVLVGVVANRRIRGGVATYLVGGRAAGASLNSASYVGTGLGLVTLMYASIDAFSNGFAYVTLALISFAISVFLGLTGFVVGPLRRLELLTISEYFEHRFDRRTRVIGGGIGALAGILNMGLFPKMGATFVTFLTGASLTAPGSETTVNLVMSLLIVLVIAYTMLGGMLSVLVTDYLQFVVLSIGLFIGVAACLSHPQLGWEGIVGAMAEHRGARMFNPVAEGGYGWIWVGFNAVVFLAAAICWAPEASRALTAKNESVARATFLLAAPGQFVRLGVPALFAAALFALAAQTPELEQHFFPAGLGGDASNAAQAMPFLLSRLLPTGVLGLVAAGMLAAFMSTHDSYLLCWSSVLTHDVIGPLTKGGLSEQAQIRITRIGVLAIGVFLLVWGVWYELPDSVWTYMAVTGTIYMSGASVVLIGGLYWSRASRAGALAALLGGLVAVVGLFRDQLAASTGLDVPGEVIGLSSFIFCAVLFVVFSLLFPDRGEP
ncbi:MAG: sodium:solute symporter family protein [Candidatus Binatia bacterium]|nr:sodium:solute symporter family protein [Candidatus Binatia bacterium]